MLLRFIATIVMVSALATGCVQVDKGTGFSAENSSTPTTPVTRGPSDTNGGTDATHTPKSFPTDKPYSEWVTPRNQHEVLAAIANEEIGPGNLFASSPEALEAFRSQVAGRKGWTFLPLSKENFKEYRVLLHEKPEGFLVIEGHLLNSAQYQVYTVEWWNERTKAEWARIRWDNLPHVLTSVVLGEVPNAEQLFTNSQAYDKFKNLFPDRSWEFRVEAFKGGMDELVVDVVHDGQLSGTLTLAVDQAGIEDVDYRPRRQ